MSSNEPIRFTAGDTVTWTASHSSYLSTDGWVSKTVFVRAGVQKIVTATSEADGSFLFTLTAALSGWDEGEYRWKRYVEKDGERHTLESGETFVEANFAAATGGHDGRSHAVKALEAIEAVLERRATAAHESYSVDTAQGSRAVGFIPLSDLRVLRDRYRAEVASEKRAERLAKGLGSGKILTRMGGL